MSSPNSKLLQAALAPSLKAAGFKKAGATWSRPSPLTIAVVNLQGSQWGPQFYVNLGVYFRELGGKLKPCEAECHIRTRLDAHVPDRARLRQLLDFEHDVDIQTRGMELASLVQEYGLPWISHVSTVEGAREWCQQNPRSPWAMGVLREYLGLSAPPNKSLQRTGGP
jgi:hypothetical protein